MRNRNCEYGFTLIELLVVVAIIAILAAILMPVFLRAKERGRQIVCLNNEHNLWLALRMYADDNDGRFPQVRAFNTEDGGGGPGRPYYLNWCGAEYVNRWCYPDKGTIWRYIKSKKSFLCPSDVNKPAECIESNRVPPGESKKTYPLSYSMNWTLAWKRADALPQQNVRYLPVLIHEKRSTINDGDWKWDPTNTLDIPDDVHFEGTNIVFVDGHVKRESAATIKANIMLGDGGPYDARQNPPNYP